MESRVLHPWNVSPAEALQIQNRLRDMTRIEPFSGKVRTIAGSDISYNRFSDLAHAVFVVLDFKTLKVIAQSAASARMTMPYIPGLLTFREAPALLEAWKKLDVAPDVIVFDGQGIAHPRRLGIAAHMGLLIDRPAIGCGKSLLSGHFDTLASEAGSTSPLIDQNEIVGAALRTKKNVQPVYISPGHRMDVESAVRIMRGATGAYRIPEPTRQAHLQANELRRSVGS